MEKPLRKYGYKAIIIIGGALVFLSLFMFPLWESVTFWFILRMLIGIGDHCLHFATQTWLTSTAKQDSLGKTMAIYGLAFGVGFAVGPLMTNLLKISQALPFIVSSILCLIAWSFVFFVKNEKPEALKGDSKESTSSIERYKLSIKYAWIAFLPPLAYGVLETCINSLFPVYALRKDFDVPMVSIILAAFSIGGIVTQVPIGMLGDKIGRLNIILITFLGGAVIFGIGSILENYELLIAIVFFAAGMFLGSMYSLGITYMADLTPKNLLPTGNLMVSIFFSFGSLIGPTIGGLYLQYVESFSFLLFIAFILFVLCLVIYLFGNKTRLIEQ